MATLPYVTAPGNIPKALNAIISASTPSRVSQDFVKDVLGIPGGSGDQMTSYLKKIGFAATDGTPTDVYRKFRNASTRGAAAAQAIKRGYAPLFKRNEYMYKLNGTKLKGLIIEETGAEDDASSVSCTFSCIEKLKAYANFDASLGAESTGAPQLKERQQNERQGPPLPHLPSAGMGLNLGYTINLNLPPVTDIAVFNAIFKSLKENLLQAGNE